MGKQHLAILLGCIFVIALFLRLFQLSEFPVGFHIDEASKGYTAYSILQTGRDDNNKSFPMYIDIFGDNSPAGYHYITIIPVAFFGLTEFAVRLPGAFFGSLTILAFYFLAYTLFENKKISLVAALLIGISPWHIILSRASSEGIVALFFIVSGFSLLVLSLKTQRVKHLIFGVSLLIISFFFYQTPRVFVPLLYLALIISLFTFWRTQISSRFKRAFLFLFLVLLLIDFLLIFTAAGGTGRFSQVSIFNSSETRLVMEEQIREDGVNDTGLFVTRVFHNKAINYSLTYASNYLQYLTGKFLFTEKGLPPWYSVPGTGLLYLIELPFILLGFFLLARHRDKTYKIPLYWLFIAPTAAAITVDVPNLQRALVMFPAIEMFAAYGLVRCFGSINGLKKITLLLLLTLLFLYHISYFLHQYFVHSKVHRPWYRYNGFAEMIQTVNKSYDTYDKIIVTKSAGGIYPLTLFYTKYDPAQYQKEGSPKDRDYSGFGKFFFVPMDCPSRQQDPRFPKVKHAIYVDKGNCPEEKIDKQSVDLNYVYNEAFIYREDGTNAFRIVYEDAI